jgi:hypothetical protein
MEALGGAWARFTQWRFTGGKPMPGVTCCRLPDGRCGLLDRRRNSIVITKDLVRSSLTKTGVDGSYSCGRPGCLEASRSTCCLFIVGAFMSVRCLRHTMMSESLSSSLHDAICVLLDEGGAPLSRHSLARCRRI